MDAINDTSKTKAGLLSTTTELFVTLCCTEIMTELDSHEHLNKKV